MSFYLKPPRGLTHYHKLEECVKQRLLFYEHLNTGEAIPINNFNCLLEDSALDRTGHFMLRLATFSNLLFEKNFIQNECKLLQVRLDAYNRSDERFLLKKLYRQCRDCLEENNIGDNLQKIYFNLCRICKQLLFIPVNNSSAIMQIPFYCCLSLVVKREAHLEKGFIHFQYDEWKKVFISIFDTFLKITLKEMRLSQAVHDLLLDARIKSVLQLVEGKSNIYNELSLSTFNLNFIEKESRLFPLCMQSLYKVLQKTNRLPHNERFQFSLYLKGIGVSLPDSIKFWQTVYSKEPSTCSKCTHSWSQNEKKYIYGIRHLYGFEGGRKNYTASSCRYLQELTLGANDEGGCPFKHFDDNNLREKLKQLLPNCDDQIEVIIYERRDNPNEGCRLFSEQIMAADERQLATENEFFQGPVEYYLKMKDKANFHHF